MRLLSLVLFAQLLQFAALAQPVNDDCSNLINLGVVPYCSAAAQYSNVGATQSIISATANVPGCFLNDAERDVWFSFTLPPDGSITDVVISVFGNVGGNGTMNMPEVAVYRGDCGFNNLEEYNCAAAAINVNQVSLELLNLTVGFTYYLRINDWSATASPNAGTFKLCVEPYVAEFNMGDVVGAQSCTGTLYDSGGPSGDYGQDEDYSFTICPQDFHQCILINVESYETENNPGTFSDDAIGIYAGNDPGTGVLIGQLAGSGGNLQIPISTSCATITFNSDFSVEDAGFKNYLDLYTQSLPNAQYGFLPDAGCHRRFTIF